MKRAQIIGIAIAGSAGVLAFMMMQGILNQPQVEKTVEVQVKSTEVLVARADIGLGQIANESLFRWQSWPQEAATTGFVTKASNPNALTQYSGAIARSPIMAGEPITSQKLIKAGQGGVLAAILPAGMRAVSTKIKDETAVAKLILPNDRVDVILIRRMRSRNSADEYGSDTLFRNVRVLAVGQQIDSKEGKKAAEGSASTATLELTPRQSELLALANSLGEISLSLRSISDLEADGTGPIAGDDLDKSKNSTAIRVLRYGVSSRAYSVN
jgi:pilus assembly protein CpaB